jgi:CheY-like chemotaxis protein
MTAHAFAGEREKALSNGMNDYISKPIKEEDLFRLIARFVPLIRNSLPLSDTGETDISGQPPADRNRLSIDYNFLMESSKGKKEYLRDILELFLQQAPLEIARIDQAMIEGKRESVGKLAHHMKSTVGYVGLDNSFRPLLENIERQVKNNGSPDDLKLLVAHLKQLTKDAIEKVKTEAMPLVEKKEN